MSNVLYDLLKIKELLLDAFTDRELRNLCRYRQEFRPVLRRISPAAATEDVVDELIEHAGRTSNIRTLLDWAKEENLALYEKFGPYRLAESAVPEGTAGAMQPERIREFLDRASLVPEATEAVARARKSFEYNCHQIQSMSEFKTTHDLLQTLEDGYRSLHDQLCDEGSAVRPLVERDWLITARGRKALQTQTLKLVQQVEVMSFRADAEDWLETLRASHADLQAAYDSKDINLLGKALRAIERVITTRTSSMNVRLISAIDGLQLADLVQELQSVYKIVKTHRDAATDRELQDFATVVAELGTMTDRLVACRKEHDAWQQLDNSLRTEQNQLSLNVGRFKDQWDDVLRGRMLELCAPLEPGWEQDPDSWINKLDEELARTPVDPDAVAYAFFECRSVATNHFVRVDGRLKNLCDDLAEAGASVRVVLEKLP